jgi:hypothetical protein
MINHFVIFLLCFCFLTGCASGFKQCKQEEYQVIAYGETKDTSLFIKYSTRTGQSWFLADEWQPIPDDEVLLESKYVIKVVSMPDRMYTAVRLDTVSGKSWSAINNRWVEIKTKNE